jgi:hypothetical protein
MGKEVRCQRCQKFGGYLDSSTENIERPPYFCFSCFRELDEDELERLGILNRKIKQSIIDSILDEEK